MMKRNHLLRRAVISLTGSERTSFLNGLITGDAQSLPVNSTCWTAMLNAQGRIQTLFFLWKTETSLLLDLPENQVDSFMKSLRRFRLRADVQIERLDHLVLTGAPDIPPLENAIIQAMDPRHPALGWRALVPVSSGDDNDFSKDPTLLSRRLLIGVPDDEDIIIGQTLVLEANMDHLNGVSWTKGCYLGQEVTARTHYRGLIKKRILPVVSVTGQTLPDGGTVTLNGQDVGELRSREGQRGLALLHRKAWSTEAELMLGDQPIRLDWPDWLPKNDSSEEGQQPT
ncbi:CAF17-like 4Fe-4S cluster assembly/insertion protein YgfZ [Bombella mellum]|nr:folate-binding protein YgfZ [Bombella mellum]